MCGIVLVRGKNSVNQVKKYLTKIEHRGTQPPQIKKINEQLSIGFVRLPINDLSKNANQPFIHKNLIGVFNCEIYNYVRLRKKYNLQPQLISECDAEIILPLFHKLQNQDNSFQEIFSNLDGFYSGIIYDTQKDIIYCIKDYIGKKPLFLIHKDDTIIITSELKAVDSFDKFKIIPKGASIIKSKTIKQIYKFKYNEKLENKNNIQELLYQAVKKRIPHKKYQSKFGIFLSGGIDSSIIATIAYKITIQNNQFSQPIFYCLSDLNDKKYADSRYINIMIDYLNIQNCTKMVSVPSDTLKIKNIIKKIIYQTESYNPSIITNGIAYYLLTSQVKKDGIKVILTGDVADEMFLGYAKKSKEEYRKYWSDTLNDLHFTELRRIDLTSMVNEVEIRCPFLDKSIYQYSSKLLYTDFYGKKKPIIKYHLKQAFKDQLPNSIIERDKTPLDVGSGIQKKVLPQSDAKQQGVLAEKEKFKNIWLKLFPDRKEIVDSFYFHKYPAFESFTKSRWNKYNRE